MKKVILALAMVLSIAIFAVGCSSPTNEESKNSNPESSATESKDLETESSDVESEEVKTDSKTKFGPLIPDPEVIFQDGEITILDHPSSYIFQVRNYTEDEYETYISKCKEMGFDDVSYESKNDGGNMFGAYTSDGKYWVEVLMGNDNGILAVTCKESTKKS